MLKKNGITKKLIEQDGFVYSIRGVPSYCSHPCKFCDLYGINGVSGVCGLNPSNGRCSADVFFVCEGVLLKSLKDYVK